MKKIKSIKTSLNFYYLLYSICAIFVLNLNVVAGDASSIDKITETAQNKKILYLHVGTHKTGTSTIQEECSKNRSKLQQFSVLYPESVSQGVNHHAIAHLIMDGELEKVNQYIIKIKEQSKNYDSVLLSSEVFTYACMSPNFESFLNSLRQHFTVRIVYVDRDFKDRVASLVSYLVVIGGNKKLTEFYPPDVKSIDDYIKIVKEKDEEAKQFFAHQDAKFLSYEELKKNKKFVQTFLKQAADVDIEIPDSYYNTMEQVIGLERSVEDLREMEIFFGVPTDTFVQAWEQSKGPAKYEFAKLIAKLTKERAVALYDETAKKPKL